MLVRWGLCCGFTTGRGRVSPSAVISAPTRRDGMPWTGKGIWSWCGAPVAVQQSCTEADSPMPWCCPSPWCRAAPGWSAIASAAAGCSRSSPNWVIPWRLARTPPDRPVAIALTVPPPRTWWASRTGTSGLAVPSAEAGAPCYSMGRWCCGPPPLCCGGRCLTRGQRLPDCRCYPSALRSLQQLLRQALMQQLGLSHWRYWRPDPKAWTAMAPSD